jgi:hypothetical protein
MRPPINWRKGQALKIQINILHLDKVHQIPKEWGPTVETALIKSDSLILPPKNLIYLFGNNQAPPKLLLSSSARKTLLATPLLTADLQLTGSFDFQRSYQSLRKHKGCHELLSESLLVSEDLCSFSELFTGRAEDLLDPLSPIQARSSNHSVRLGFTRSHPRAPGGLSISLRIQIPGLLGGSAKEEEIVFQPFFVPKKGLCLAFVFRSPLARPDLLPPSAFVVLIKAQRAQWRSQALSCQIIEADLARQRVLSAGVYKALTKNQVRNDLIAFTKQVTRELVIALELLDHVQQNHRAEDWRQALQQWNRSSQANDRSAVDPLERIFGNAWHPTARTLRTKGPQIWLQKILTEIDELSGGEIMNELVRLNRKALQSNDLSIRWRAMEWFRWLFPDIPQRRIPFAIQPAPAFLIVLDSVLENHGFTPQQ